MQDREGNLLDRREMLRVKVKSLAAEAKMIRFEESKAKRRGRSRKLSSMDTLMLLYPEHAMKFPERPVLTLEEKKAIALFRRLERKKARGMGQFALFNELYRHRIDEVRKHARHASIAYGLIRGRRYEQMEQKCVKPPEWEEIERLCKKYGPAGFEVPKKPEFVGDDRFYKPVSHR